MNWKELWEEYDVWLTEQSFIVSWKEEKAKIQQLVEKHMLEFIRTPYVGRA